MSLILAASGLRSIHETFGWVVVGANLVAGAWATLAHFKPKLRHRSLWWFTSVAELTIVVQVILGVALRQELFADSAAPEHLNFHMFYGFIALFSMAIIYSYRAQMKDQIHLLYGAGGLFLAGLALRAIYINPT